MKHSDMTPVASRSNWLRGAGAVALLLLLLAVIPYPMVVARRCTVLVADGTGKPLAGQKVDRGWAFGSIETLEDGYTARDGTVTFDRRVQNHSVLGRCLAEVVNVAVVHGDAHISDGYLVSYPDGYTAEIDSDAPIKWVYGDGHLASVDLGELPRDKNCRVKFILKRAAPPASPPPPTAGE